MFWVFDVFRVFEVFAMFGKVFANGGKVFEVFAMKRNGLECIFLKALRFLAETPQT